MVSFELYFGEPEFRTGTFSLILFGSWKFSEKSVTLKYLKKWTFQLSGRKFKTNQATS